MALDVVACLDRVVLEVAESLDGTVLEIEMLVAVLDRARYLDMALRRVVKKMSGAAANFVVECSTALPAVEATVVGMAVLAYYIPF